MSMQHEEALYRLRILVGQDLVQLSQKVGVSIVADSGKINKGWAGHTIERYLGIPLNSSRAPNLGSWELKVVPAILDSNHRIRIKETMAITMIDPVEVKRKPFEESHLFDKLNKVIAVIREHTDDNCRSVVLECSSFQLSQSLFFSKVKSDYEAIQFALRNSVPLTGKMGTYIQPRTKGRGHGSKNRAFYARKNFVQDVFVADGLLAPHGEPTDCPKHSGQRNANRREVLDHIMVGLHRNQSGKGRHKCPYCAYEAGYRDGLARVTPA